MINYTGYNQKWNVEKADEYEYWKAYEADLSVRPVDAAFAIKTQMHLKALKSNSSL